MEAPKTIARQTSGLRNIPSFNDFGSMASEDVDAPSAPRMSVSVPKPTLMERKWSVETTESPTGRLSGSLSSSFGETFRRALYEHMRGN